MRRDRARPGARLLRWGLVGVLAVVGVLGVAAALRLSSVAADLRAARTILEDAGVSIEQGQLAEARAGLARAEELLLEANNSLYSSPELDVLGALPVVSQNLESLRDSVGVAFRLAAGGGRILDAARTLQAEDGSLEVPLQSGRLPLEAIAATRQEIADLVATLPGPADRPGTSLLFGPVAEAQDEVFDEALERRSQLDGLSRALTLAAEMSGGNGPRRYLIAVANTAEMRGTGGMILSYGVLEGDDGVLSLPAFGNIDELFLDVAVDPVALDVPEDELERWDGLQITRLWRNANMVPDLQQVAPRLEVMYEAATGQTVDGVIQIDASGLAAILAGIGPVRVDGVGLVTAENVVDLTLNQAYTLFPDRDQRQEVLGDVAAATFRRLVEGDYESLRPLGEAISRATLERHIIFVSGQPLAAGPAAFFGAGGELPHPAELDHLMLTVQNFGRNKLDYYIDSAVSVRGERLIGEASTMTIEIAVVNSAPPDTTEPAYVFGGPETGSDVPAGVYAGAVSLYVPDGSVLVDSSGDSTTEPVLTTEGGRTVIGYDVRLDGGESSTVELEVTFPPRPDAPYHLRLVPLPRVRPTGFYIEIGTGDGVVRREGPLLVPEVPTGTAPA